MNTIRLMVVDDETAVYDDVLPFPWKHYHCELVGFAQDGNQALQMIPKLQPDILLVDIVMPGMNGLELISEVRNRWPHIRCIILSMHQDFHYAAQAVRMGACEYLIKDSGSLDELVGAIIRVRDQILSEREKPDQAEMLWRRREADAQKQIASLPASGFFRYIVMDHSGKSGALYPYSDVAHFLKMFFVSDSLVPLSLESWISVDEKEDSAIIHEVKDTQNAFRHFICTSRLPYSSHDELRKMIQTCPYRMDERFYSPECVLVSGSVYDGTLPDSEREKLREQTEETLEHPGNDSAAEIISRFQAGRVAPDQMKDVLATVVQRVGMGEPDANHVIHRILQADRADTAFALCRAYILERKLRKSKYIRTEVKKVTDYIVGHLQEDLSINQLSETAGLSPNYLSMIFKQDMGLTLKQYIKQARMEKASMLLKNTDRLVYEIAQEVGYPDYRYFSDTFFATFHMTPTAYRRGNV